jgi:TPR repeat protein
MRKDNDYPGINAGFQANQTPPLFAASIYRSGAGKQSETRARHQYREALAEHQRAAEKGIRSAQEILGLMCVYGPQIYGEVLAPDLAEAYRWLWLAAAQGSLVARHVLHSIDPNSATGDGTPTLN